MNFVSKYLFCALFVIGLTSLARAQVIPPSEQPGREQFRFQQPPVPRAQPGAVMIQLPSTGAPEGAAAISLFLEDVIVEGSTVYTQQQLSPLYADVVGHVVPLQTVYDIARKITAKYGEDGYVLSRAIVPPQALSPKGAVIHLRVIEGYVDKVEWPAETQRYRDFFSEYAAKITSDRPANIHTIERYILLAGDLPGLKFSTSLRASAISPNASTLVVAVEEKAFDASARIDNRGTKARGPLEFLTSATLNNRLGLHEAFTLSCAGVFPTRHLQYVSGSYRQVLTSEGLTAFADATYSWGRPGTSALKLLEYETQGTTVDAGLSYPVIRQRERNLTLSGLAFLNNSQSNILAAPFNRDRLRGIRLKADGDLADSLGGINQLNLTFSQGFQGFGSTRNGSPLASRAAGRVDFSKIESYFSRSQPLIANFSFQVAAYGQYAGTPLLSAEQCGFGGGTFGRAFDPSQLVGDHCWEVSGELRHDLPFVASFLSRAQLYTFSDFGKLYTLKAAVGTPSRVTAASVGAGARFGILNTLDADVSVAKGVEGPRKDWRGFFAITAHY